MKSFKATFILLAIFAVVSCTKSGNTGVVGYIQLSASVTDIHVATKAAADADLNAFRGTVPTENNNLYAKILFSTTPRSYSHNPDAATSLPCHTTIRYTSGALTYPNPVNNNNVRYPTANNTYSPVYCVGLHPDDNTNYKWDISEASASRSITGEEDIMFAPQISGSWDNPFAVQQYGHLLTWLKINVSATSTDAAEAWGKITKISIKSEGKINIPLNLTEIKYDTGGITYTGETDIVTFEDPQGLALRTTLQETGSVFCSPKSSYTVEIVTENNGTITKSGIELTNLDGDKLTDIKDIAGKLFVLSLYFNDFDVVEGACTLTAWNNQYEDLYGTIN